MTQTKFAQYLLNIVKKFAQCRGYNIWPIFTQYSHNICAIFLHIRIIFDPIGMSQLMKFVGKTICWKMHFCKLYGNICIKVKGYDIDIGIGVREKDI